MADVSPSSDTAAADWEAELQTGNPTEALERLLDAERAAGHDAAIYQLRQLMARTRLGLSPVPLPGEVISDEKLRALEEELIGACKEVGTRLLARGRLAEGWVYLRPVGDKTFVRDQLAAIEVDEDNAEDAIAILYHERIDVGRGLALMLEHHGTCQTVTTFDTDAVNLAPADRKAAARVLVHYLQDELLRTVRADVAHQEGTDPSEPTLTAILAEREWLLAEGNYHADTSHLAAAVRSGRFLTEEDDLRVALDLATYGKALAPTLKFPGDEPFVDQFATHALFFAAQLPETPDHLKREAEAYFQDRADRLDNPHERQMAVEAWIDLLARTGQLDRAIAEHRRRIGPGVREYGLGPSLLELCRLRGDYTAAIDKGRQAGDVVAVAVATILARQADGQAVSSAPSG